MAKTVTKKRKDSGQEARQALPRLAEEAESFAATFKALGDPTRLRIVLYLRAAANLVVEPGVIALEEMAPESEDDADTTDTDEGTALLPGGITVGEIACHLTGSDKVTSNVSHHLKELRHAGLITMKRRGKNILCRLEDEAVLSLCRLLSEPGK